MLAPPAATTTVRARHVPWSVSTTYPSSARRTAVTVVFGLDGRRDSFAYPVDEAATSRSGHVAVRVVAG